MEGRIWRGVYVARRRPGDLTIRQRFGRLRAEIGLNSGHGAPFLTKCIIAIHLHNGRQEGYLDAISHDLIQQNGGPSERDVTLVIDLVLQCKTRLGIFLGIFTLSNLVPCDHNFLVEDIIQRPR